jgi:superfamily II DNA/RNA helicase
MEQGHVDLSEIDVAVIDEADRMADMGFLPDVRRILDAMPADRRTWLFSATLDGDIAVLTKRYQSNPRRHEVEGGDDHGAARHLFWKVEHADRAAHAAEVVSTSSPAIVFCRTRRGADNLTRKLTRLGIRAEAIHGGRSQSQRSRALAGFSRGGVEALVATDVAARGIHVDGVACVIHFDPADDAKAYLHRSGRTARAGADGVVISLVAEQHMAAVRSLQRAVGLRGDHRRPDLSELEAGGERIDPSTAPKPKTRPMKRPRNHAGKKGKQRSNQTRHRYWD